MTVLFKAFLKLLFRLTMLFIMVLLGFTIMYPEWLDNKEIIYAELFNNGMLESPQYITVKNKRIQMPNYVTKDLIADKNLYRCIKDKKKKIADIRVLDCSNKKIKSIDGIEFLTNLKNLKLSHNAIKQIPNKRISVRYLDLSFNEFTSVDVVPLLSFSSVNLSHNMISEVYFSDLPLKGLARLSTYSSKRTSSPYKHHMIPERKTHDTYFRLNNNDLEYSDYINLSEKGIKFAAFEPAIEDFPDKRLRECLKNSLGYSKQTIVKLTCKRSIENAVNNTQGISQLVNLESLDLSKNKIKSIDLSNLKNLQELKLNQNLLTTINLKNNARLQVLELFKNDFQKINFTYLKKLKKFNLRKSNRNYSSWTSNLAISAEDEYRFISGLDVAKNISRLMFPSEIFRKCILKSVVNEGKPYNQISQLNCLHHQNQTELFSLKGVKHLLGLRRLAISGAKISSINLSLFRFLGQIRITHSSIDSIILPSFKKIGFGLDKSYVYLVNANLKEVKFTSPCNYNKLNLNDNSIKTIEFPQSCNLEYLDLSQNKVEKIDMNNLKNISYIDISNNQLKEINMNALMQLKTLILNDNLLKHLDLLANINLKSISIFNTFLNYENTVLSPAWNMLHLDYNQLYLFRKNLKSTELQYQKNKGVFVLYKNK